jgi:hypothetical protein
MNVLPQLERDLVDAHARVVARRNRVWHAWLVRRARRARTGPEGSRAQARGWAIAGVRAVPALLAVGVVLALGAAFLVLAHARHASSLTPAARLLREQQYITIARLQTERRDPACVAVAPTFSVSGGTPSKALLSSLAVLHGAGSAPVPIGVLSDDLHHVGPPIPTGVYVRFERLARTVTLPATRSAPAMSVRYYVVAAGTVTGAATVPMRCDAEQTAALRGELPQIPKDLRTPTLQLAAQVLAQRRAIARQAEGIALVALSPSGGGAFVDAFSASTTQLQRRGAISQTGSQWGKGLILSGVVPDGVATITLHFPGQLRAGKAAPPFSVTTHPVRNVFVVRLPRTYVTQAFGGITPDTTIWRAANGTVINTIHQSS